MSIIDDLLAQYEKSTYVYKNQYNVTNDLLLLEIILYTFLYRYTFIEVGFIFP